MKKIIVTTSVLVFTLAFSLKAQDGREVMKKTYDVSDIDAMEMITTLKIYDQKGRERVRQMSTASKKFGGTTKMITKFLSPADVKGTGILIFDYKDKDDDMWIYLPALRKTRRIVSSEKSKSYMGSEFSNADMSKPNLDDFNYELLGTEDYEGKECWKLAIVPKNEDVEDKFGFSKKISLIGKNDFYTWKVDYYDLNGDLYKTMRFSDYLKVGESNALAKIMEIENLQNGRHSELIIDKLQNGSDLNENTFSVGMLQK